jgi:hypothetical protein
MALMAISIGCGSTASELRPQPVDGNAQICETDGRAAVAAYSQALTLAAALPTTAGAVAQWEYTRFGPNGPRPVVSRWSSLAPDHKVVFCYLDGDFSNYSPPGGGRHIPFERALVVATESQGARLDHIGSKATTPLTAP